MRAGVIRVGISGALNVTAEAGLEAMLPNRRCAFGVAPRLTTVRLPLSAPHASAATQGRCAWRGHWPREGEEGPEPGER